MPDPAQQQEQQGLDAAAGDQQQQAYDAGAGSANPYDGYAWDPNYYANYGGNYGLDPSGNVNYGAEPQYAAYVVEQGAVYGGDGYGGEQSGGYGYSTAPPSGTEYTGAYRPEVAEMAAPPVQEPVMPPEMGRIGGKRGRRDVPMEILEVNQAELMKNRPREDKSKLTGLAFGPSYQVQTNHFIITLYYFCLALVILFVDSTFELDCSLHRSSSLLLNLFTIIGPFNLFHKCMYLDVF
jgi:proline-rich protein PRCC